MAQETSHRSKKRTRDDPQVRRAQILDAAIHIIGERGYYGFAVQDLAQRCGITTGGLLYHFGTKEGLLLAVLEEYERRMKVSLRQILSGFAADDFSDDPLPLAAGISLIRAIVVYSAAQPELMRLYAVLQAESLNHTHPGFDFFREREATILNMFTRIVGAHCVDPVATARQIFALMSGLEHRWLRADCSFDLPAEWDKAIAKILPEGAAK